MKFPWLKFLVLLAIWYQVSIVLGLPGGAAFYVALLVIVLGWLASSLPGQIFRMLGPRTQSMIVHVLLWLVIFWWFAPPVIFDLPLVVHGFVLYGLAIAGARARGLYERERARLGDQLYSEHAGMVVGLLFGGLLFVMTSLRVWHSLWPVIFLGLLPGIPFSFGWRMGSPELAPRADAKVGDAGDFQDAGLSEDR